MTVCAALLLAAACTHHPETTLRPTSLLTEATAQLVNDRALGALVGAVIGSHDVYELNSGFVPLVSMTIGPGRAGGGLS